jgi:hypothetical protein
MMTAMTTGGSQKNYIRPPGKIKVPARHRASRAAGRMAAVGLVGLLVLSACAAGPRLEPVVDPAQRSVTLAETGVRLTVLPNTWSAYPGDLPQHFTPIEVRIENMRDDELLIRLEDFAALDEARQQYRALPPGEVAQVVSGGADNDPAHEPAALRLAGPWYPYRSRYWAPYWGPYYGPYGPWGYWGPYYPYYWGRPFPQDVLTLGLREGSLLPGAGLQGFLYFQRATARGNSLTVSWTPRLSSGTALPTLSTRFRIVR